jgi:chloride channel protein, CIC family
MSPKPNIFSTFLDRAAPPLGLTLIILSVAIGAGTGLAAVIFIKLIYGIEYFCYGYLPKLFPAVDIWIYLIIPVIGGILVGPLILFAHEAKGHGVPEVMQALIVHGGRIRARVAAAKILASALCIGTGGSAGREGPIVQVGSALGSGLGQILNLSDERIRNMVACGAAAGIAATFNAPIAGVIFSIEVLMSGLQVRAFGNVVIAAVSSSIVSRIFLGARPAFEVPDYTLVSPLSILLYLFLGLLAALVGIMFIRMLDFSERVFDNWQFPQLLKPAVGALGLGVIGITYMFIPGVGVPETIRAQMDNPILQSIPHMYGSGFSFISTAITGHGGLWVLLLLVFLKPLATSFTLGSGNSGGVFAPSLFIGAMLGGTMGHLFEIWFPSISGGAGAYALVGMAAVFSATARAPLTAMLIVFEMSNDYLIILPLMVAGVTACYFAQWLHPESIYTLKLSKRDIRFAEGRDMDIMQGVRVSEVMKVNPVTIHKDKPLYELMSLFQESNFLGFPVLSDYSKLYGIVTLQDIHKLQSQEDFSPKNMTVKDVAIESPITVFPDEPIWAAIQKMAPRDLARLPVIDRDGSQTLLGVISRSDILRAYDVGIVRKQRGQILEGQTSLRSMKENGFVEFVLKEDDNCSMAQVKDLPLPKTVNLVSIRRGGSIIIPRGNTRLQSGDVVTVFGKLSDVHKIKDLMNSCELNT